MRFWLLMTSVLRIWFMQVFARSKKRTSQGQGVDGRRWVAGSRALLLPFFPGDLFLGNLDLDMLYTKMISNLRKIEYIYNQQINSYKIERINGEKKNQFSYRG